MTFCPAYDGWMITTRRQTKETKEKIAQTAR